VPHQANHRIIDAACDRSGSRWTGPPIVLDRTGNTSAASIPLALADAARPGRVADGDLVLLVGFGAGMTWASAVLRWDPPVSPMAPDPTRPARARHRRQPGHRPRHRPPRRRRRPPGGHHLPLVARRRRRGLLCVPCDVTDTDQVDAAFATVEERARPVEVLVSNAGITRDGLLLRMSDDDFTDVLDANLTGAFRVAKRGRSRP
jgi:hypothetical protein